MSRKTLLNCLPLMALGLLALTGPARTAGPADTGHQRAAAAPTVPAGHAAAGGLQLVTADGQPLDLNRFQGKAVFVNLWATWCPPCRAEMPSIQALYERVDSSKVAFVMISLDKNPAKAQKYVQRQGFGFPVYFPAAPLPPPFDSQAIPSTIILSPDGRVAARYEGMVDYNTADFQQALEKLATRQ